MGRDRLVDQIAQAMARAENASEDHFEAYRHVAEAVAAVVEPLLAEKDKAAVEVVERLLRATQDDPDAGDLHLARHKAREFLAGRAASEVGSTGFVPSEGADQCSHCDGRGLMQTGYTGTLQYCGECNACDGSGTVPVVTDEERVGLRSACSKCGGLVRLELRCEVCGDLPAVEGAESWICRYCGKRRHYPGQTFCESADANDPLRSTAWRKLCAPAPTRTIKVTPVAEAAAAVIRSADEWTPPKAES